MKPRVLLVHPGTQHAPRLARELENQGALLRFWTGFAQSTRAASGGAVAQRRPVDIPSDKLRTLPWVEASALILSRLPINKERLWHWRNAVFQRLVPQNEIEASDVVVGFDTAAWIVGARARQAGRKFVLDQSVAHPLSRANVVLAAGGDSAMWPEAFVPRLDMVQRAEAEEHRLADVVVVASSFAKRTIVENGVSADKVRVLPYGVGPEWLAIGAARTARASRRPFRFLYVGYLTKRKGLNVLFHAWEGMEAQGLELRLAGGGGLEGGCPPGVVQLGQTSREQLQREMAEADAFVFPSLFEGFGLVVLEAMAAGLPVITTENTAGVDLIESGVNGLLVPPADVGALRGALAALAQSPGKAREMGLAAHQVAAGYTWKKYGERWGAMLQELGS